MKKVLLIATYDSFLNSGLSVAKNINNAIIDIKIRISTQNQLSSKQISNALKNESIPYSFFYLNNYQTINFIEYDIIIISAGNAFHHSFFEYFVEYQASINKKIITISLFPGVIFGEIDSIVSRINADILLCNNKMDYKVANIIKNHSQLNTEILLYGYPILQKINIKEKKYIYFFEQVKIPETRIDRIFLISKLVTLAKQYPKETFYIKPRVSIDEKTIHPNKYPLEVLLNEYSKEHILPTNLHFTYDDVNLCLSQAKSIITISSTVAFEAIYNNIPTYIISDFGIRKEFANYHFIESNCMCTFSEILQKNININLEWSQKMLFFPENRIETLNKTIENYKKVSTYQKTLNTQSIEYIKFIQTPSKKQKYFLRFQAYLKKILQRKLQKFLGC